MREETEAIDRTEAEEDEAASPAGAIPAWKRPKGEAILTVAPHKSHLRVGETLHLDVFLWNRSDETVWVERGLKAGIGLWIRVFNQAGEDIYYPPIKYKVAPPTSIERFVCLEPRMGQAAYDVTGDAITLPEPGRYTVTATHDHAPYQSRLCAACFGLALAYVEPVQCEVFVEEPK